MTSTDGVSPTELIRPPTSEGGVWGSFVEYLERLEVAVAERDEARNDLKRAREAGKDWKGSYLKLKVERDVAIITEIELRARILDAEARSASALVLIDQIEKLLRERSVSSDSLFARLDRLFAVYRNEVNDANRG